MHVAKQALSAIIITADPAYVDCDLALHVPSQCFVPTSQNIAHALPGKLTDNLNSNFVSPVKDLKSSHSQLSPTTLSRLQKGKSGYKPINKFLGTDRTGSAD